jgi:hypothetical protein
MSLPKSVNQIQIALLAISLITASCAKKGEQNAQNPDTSATASVAKVEVKIIPADQSPAFPDAKLVIVSPKEGQIFKNASDSVKVVMKVTGMDLAKPTDGDSTKGIAYSKQGQHVHVIIDSKPYMADYKNGEPFNVGLLTPGEHTIRAFPSRSWHESVKEPAAFATRTFYVGSGLEKGATDSMAATLKAPMLTYSRPKGTYTADEGKKLLLDFFVSNAKLGANDYKVAVSVDAIAIDTLTDWKPYYITGLTTGKHSVSLQLLDAKGAPVPGKYNSPMGEITIQ